MHPPLALHKHPTCEEIIVKFKLCHQEHPVAKFWGACNDLKKQLDRCFREEKRAKQRANLEESRRFREKLSASRAAGTPQWSQATAGSESAAGREAAAEGR